MGKVDSILTNLFRKVDNLILLLYHYENGSMENTKVENY